MEKIKVVIATIHPWNIQAAHKFIRRHPDIDVLLMTAEEQLTCSKIRKFRPHYIFFPHWSWRIPAQIHMNYECIVFHMTDLPFGRGGSPLQNLITRGIYRTKISAIKAGKNMDAGSVYLKEKLDLKGPASDIFLRASRIIFEKMIPYIIRNKPVACPQKGKVVIFKRRTPQQSDISGLRSARKIYDYIRMLDAESYPNAYIQTGVLKVNFTEARLNGRVVTARAKIEVLK